MGSESSQLHSPCWYLRVHFAAWPMTVIFLCVLIPSCLIIYYYLLQKHLSLGRYQLQLSAYVSSQQLYSHKEYSIYGRVLQYWSFLVHIILHEKLLLQNYQNFSHYYQFVLVFHSHEDTATAMPAILSFTTHRVHWVYNGAPGIILLT